MLILVTQNLNEAEKTKCKIKYAKVEDKLALNFYLDNNSFLEKSLPNRISYVDFVISNSLVKNKQIKKLGIDIPLFRNDLNFFFEKVLSNNE
jgi:hypothetical protein